MAPLEDGAAEITRSTVMRLGFLALDHPDISSAATEPARGETTDARRQDDRPLDSLHRLVNNCGEAETHGIIKVCSSAFHVKNLTCELGFWASTCGSVHGQLCGGRGGSTTWLPQDPSLGSFVST